jgi:hypothetical protein
LVPHICRVHVVIVVRLVLCLQKPIENVLGILRAGLRVLMIVLIDRSVVMLIVLLHLLSELLKSLLLLLGS